MAIYEPGEQVPLFCDIFPSSVTPSPPGWPTGVKVRTIVSQRCMTLAWQAGGINAPIQRIDLPMTVEDTAETTFRGGVVGTYTVAQASGCRCNGRAVLGWEPFPGVIWVQDPRVEKLVPNRSGLIPPPDSRV